MIHKIIEYNYTAMSKREIENSMDEWGQGGFIVAATSIYIDSLGNARMVVIYTRPAAS